MNVALVFLETFGDFTKEIQRIFICIELFSTAIFSIEYVLRIWTSTLMYPDLPPAKARIKYMFSFIAIIDLVAILPFYLPLIITHNLKGFRSLSLLRILGILKFNRYTSALSSVGHVIKKKAPQLISSIFVVLLLMLIASILMYNIEHEAQPEVFDNALSGLWWAISTLTTVGYGDIYPITGVGKLLSAVIALLGIGLVAVPTGIISAGFMEHISEENEDDEKCFCPYCGKKIKH